MSGLPNLLSSYFDTWQRAASRKSPPPEGCATIAGSVNCGKEAFQLKVGRCALDATNSTGAGVGSPNTDDLIKRKIAGCISRNIYGDESEQDKILKTINDIDWAKVSGKADSQAEQSIDNLVKDPDAEGEDEKISCSVEGIGWLLG